MCKQCTYYGSCQFAKQRELQRCESFKLKQYDEAQLYQAFLRVEKARKDLEEAKLSLESSESFILNMVMQIQAQPNKDEVLSRFEDLKRKPID